MLINLMLGCRSSIELYLRILFIVNPFFNSFSLLFVSLSTVDFNLFYFRSRSSAYDPLILMRIRIMDPNLKKWIRIQIQIMNISLGFAYLLNNCRNKKMNSFLSFR